MQLNQDEEQAKRHRELIDKDRSKLLRREEMRVARYEMRLAAAIHPKAIQKATMRLMRAKKRLVEVKINGSVVKSKRRFRARR